ncbi:MAG: threonine synthase [Promethearchaeota archaeon]
MKFHSTNYNSKEVDFKTVILQGQAFDKGLYMLNKIPKLNKKILDSLKNMDFAEIVLKIISKFIRNIIPEDKLKKLVKTALNFKIPIEKITNNDYLCYLDHGPTCSFKDFGARMLAKIMEHFLEIENKKLTILTATSGDTGGAVAHAFYEIPRINIIILYPKNEISDLQRKQMTTLGKNVIALGINKKFDDCQNLVKIAFTDKDLQSINLSSANSINFGRLFPQTLYYFWSYSRIIERKEEEVIFSVPSGNFGNLTAGLIAKRMGLPVKRFIAAVNENDEFPKFLRAGIYKKVEPSKNCISNAMNVGHPSNLARIFDLYGGQIDETGYVHKTPNMEEIRKDIISYSISDTATKDTIIEFYDKYKKIIEPPGAVGWAALQIYRNNYLEQKSIKSITFETANPSKFPDEIISSINIIPEMPNSLKKIRGNKELPNLTKIRNYQDFKSFLLEELSNKN